MKKTIKDIFKDSIAVKEASLDCNMDAIIQAVKEITRALKKNKKVILFGNGGSAADSQHIAAEFVGRFQRERPALPAISLTTDTSALTALANDYGFDIVFARQLEALGSKGDVAIGLSTSGNSPNVLLALKQAKKMGLKTISFTGGKGGKMAPVTDIKIVVPSQITARVQETHICIAHCICELVENQFAK
ncbi:MAG: D-sedoheptulose 7-phosphate isomerase [Candidatus Omnitrophica bacterium]|nr:D-sedoheptulose 7-phosphate isomerase [Candidatus Omnitrophota bacterium]